MAALLLIYSYSWVLAYHETFDASKTNFPRFYLVISVVVTAIFFLYSVCMRIAIQFVDPSDVSLFLNGLLCLCFAGVLLTYALRTHHSLRSMVSSPKVALAKRNALWMTIALAVLLFAFLIRFIAMSFSQFAASPVLESLAALFDVFLVIFPTTILWLVLVTLVLLTVLSSSSVFESSSRESFKESQVSLLSDEKPKPPKLYADI